MKLLRPHHVHTAVPTLKHLDPLAGLQQVVADAPAHLEHFELDRAHAVSVEHGVGQAFLQLEDLSLQIIGSTNLAFHRNSSEWPSVNGSKDLDERPLTPPLSCDQTPASPKKTGMQVCVKACKAIRLQ